MTILSCQQLPLAFVGPEFGIAKLVLVLRKASLFITLPFGPIDTFLGAVIMDPMKSSWRQTMQRSSLMAAVLLVSATCVFGQLPNQVTMQLTSPVSGSPNMGGFYTNPYQATIGAPNQTVGPISGTPTPVICDDFLTDVTTGMIWQATSMTLGDLLRYDQLHNAPDTAVKFDTTGSALRQEQDYVAAASLANLIFGTSDTTLQGQYTYALWSIFVPSAMNQLTGTDLSAAQADLANAQTFASNASNLNATMWDGLALYTPCCGFTSQEFDAFSSATGAAVPTPEPSASALFAFYLSSLVGLIVLFRRRVVRAAN
jgi:hypothetical protein